MVSNITFSLAFQLTPSEEAFLRNYAGVVHSQMSQLPQHNIDQGKAPIGTRTQTSKARSDPDYKRYLVCPKDYCIQSSD